MINTGFEKNCSGDVKEYPDNDAHHFIEIQFNSSNAAVTDTVTEQKPQWCHNRKNRQVENNTFKLKMVLQQNARQREGCRNMVQ